MGRLDTMIGEQRYKTHSCLAVCAEMAMCGIAVILGLAAGRGQGCRGEQAPKRRPNQNKYGNTGEKNPC